MIYINRYAQIWNDASSASEIGHLHCFPSMFAVEMLFLLSLLLLLLFSSPYLETRRSTNVPQPRREEKEIKNYEENSHVFVLDLVEAGIQIMKLFLCASMHGIAYRLFCLKSISNTQCGA